MEVTILFFLYKGERRAVSEKPNLLRQQIITNVTSGNEIHGKRQKSSRAVWGRPWQHIGFFVKGCNSYESAFPLTWKSGAGVGGGGLPPHNALYGILRPKEVSFSG